MRLQESILMGVGHRRLKPSFALSTSAGFPSTSIFGVMPRPGAVDAAMRPFTRCGAPSAVLTVT